MNDPRQSLRNKIEQVDQELLGHVAEGGSVAVVKAPPGSGKTYLLLRAVAHARSQEQRVAIATQTNAQAKDVCLRLTRDYPSVQCVRFARSSADPEDLGPSVEWVTDTKDLPIGPCVVVGNSAKWGLVNLTQPFDVLFIDEAWQLSWADLMPLQQVAGRFVMIGDPGQIPPVVPIVPSRRETASTPPHGLLRKWSLPEEVTCFSFTFLQPGACRTTTAFVEISTILSSARSHSLARDAFSSTLPPRGQSKTPSGSWGPYFVPRLTISTPPQGPPVERDDEVARLAVEAACGSSRLKRQRS